MLQANTLIRSWRKTLKRVGDNRYSYQTHIESVCNIVLDQKCTLIFSHTWAHLLVMDILTGNGLTQIQIRDEAVYISHSSNTFGKGMEIY